MENFEAKVHMQEDIIAKQSGMLKLLQDDNKELEEDNEKILKTIHDLEDKLA